MRIGIVNDLSIATEALRRVLARRPDHRVAWSAASGAEAVACCARDTPDLVLMDLVMPGMNGVEATRRIMAESPCPILVVTVSVGANAAMVFEAMGHGALDATDLPALAGDHDRGADKLLAKIDLIGRLSAAPVRASTPRAPVQASERKLLAIGASAGGPSAVARVLEGLPADFSGAVAVIQHIDEKFAPGMADWLGRYSRLPVRTANVGDTLQCGQVLLAATNDHLALRADGRLDYVHEPAELPYRPSVDVFYKSVGEHWRGPIVGVLLTGMGRDGAAGLRGLRQQGHHTIAQDRASSAVYGMPKAAAELDAAVEILPLDRIAARLRDLFVPNPNAIP
ncbi:chemotaxis response regulator protein-glutamate methylesterase [Lysobacter enzymogenes]|uniref:chemotaxis response regulator protein-glutamate methylesterase n=1 Tax=Lysobacter enzymogenes TaxID=69 RepID=UPI001A976F03|nr:chemotaxis response regulator protein-glutamate methylesterase [Lysobacter enzymogenes]QQP95797.1 chemotaxis response regulator protein-glutamate methylesterase [Lysobacter enzymogenes]